MSNKAIFHPYGISIPTENGDVILNAGTNMTILPQGNMITFAAQVPAGVTSINGVRGDVTLAAGPGITIDISGSTITIFAGDGYVSEDGKSAYITEDGTNYYVTES